MRPHPELSVQDPFASEGAVRLPSESVTSEMIHVEQLTSSDNDKSRHISEQKAVDTKKLSDREEDLHSWELVAYGLNYVVSAVYLIANALVFVICMCPLLLRIFKHSYVTSYVNDI